MKMSEGYLWIEWTTKIGIGCFVYLLLNLQKNLCGGLNNQQYFISIYEFETIQFCVYSFFFLYCIIYQIKPINRKKKVDGYDISLVLDLVKFFSCLNGLFKDILLGQSIQYCSHSWILDINYFLIFLLYSIFAFMSIERIRKKNSRRNVIRINTQRIAIPTIPLS